ncbi:MAG: PAS domain-containing protein, partial [bacterium]
MTARNDGRDDGANLRRQAEKKAITEKAETREALSSEETRHVLHELRVHQIELEAQNEELRKIQRQLETSQARYFDLYNLAPVGYLTVNEKNLILEVNLTAATLFGVAKRKLLGAPLARFVFREDQDIFYRRSKQLFETGKPQSYELRLVKKDGSHFWALVDMTVARDDEDGLPVCR